MTNGGIIGRLKIKNNTSKVIKEFNSLYSFNEIMVDFFIDENTFIDFSLDNVTEPSILTNNSNNSSTYLEGILLEKESILLRPSTKSKTINLNFLVSNLELYINDTNDFLNKSTEVKAKKQNEKFNKYDLLLLFDAAILFEEINPSLSFLLMQECFKQAPTLMKIEKKLKQYKKLISLDDEEVKNQ